MIEEKLLVEVNKELPKLHWVVTNTQAPFLGVLSKVYTFFIYIIYMDNEEEYKFRLIITNGIIRELIADNKEVLPLLKIAKEELRTRIYRQIASLSRDIGNLED